jgi:Arc/MetJ-type ribon-helix-helix transcriptional regulator|tara:strand:+ start:193 stop:336 length:144 start_codon:yes stop_codon:yes gene_type:complete
MAKKPVSATIEQNLIEWIEEMCKDKTRFRNKSHLIEIALAKLKEQEE